MQFIEGTNRHQIYFSTLEDQVSSDNPVRLIDAFVDKLDLLKLSFTNTVHKSEGRPPYAPAVLFEALPVSHVWQYRRFLVEVSVLIIRLLLVFVILLPF